MGKGGVKCCAARLPLDHVVAHALMRLEFLHFQASAAPTKA
jgi:hypothetical protein